MKCVSAKSCLRNWIEEIFALRSINRNTSPIINTYTLKDCKGELIEGSFYQDEIKAIIHYEYEFIVEKVIRISKRGVK